MKKKQKDCFRNCFDWLINWLFCYNIFIKKSKIKSLKKIDLLQELRSYDELNIYQMSKSIGCYASCNFEIVDSKDPLV